jgi:hypothetical protein
MQGMGERIVTTQRRRIMGNNTTLEAPSNENIKVEKFIQQIREIVPPFAEANKFGGAKFTPSNRDYGNFPDSKRIDEILNNMRQIKQI